MSFRKIQVTNLSSDVTVFNDPLVVLNNNESGSNNNDIGFIFERGTDSNALLNLISENFSEKNLDTFTYGFENDPNFDESKKVKKLILNSKIYKIFHHIYHPMRLSTILKR